MDQILESISSNPAIGLAIVLLGIALVLSFVKKLVKLAALVLIVFGALGYFLQSGGELPETLGDPPTVDLDNAADKVRDVAGTMKERFEDTKEAVETIKDKLPDIEKAAEMVESLEEPAKVVGEALQNTASDVAETTKKLPSTLKDILPNRKTASDEPATEVSETNERKVRNEMLDMVKKRSSMLKARIKEAAESTKSE